MFCCCCQEDGSAGEVVTAHTHGLRKPGESPPPALDKLMKREYEECYTEGTSESRNYTEVLQLAEPKLDGKSVEDFEEIYGMTVTTIKAAKPKIVDEPTSEPVAPTLLGANLQQNAGDKDGSKYEATKPQHGDETPPPPVAPTLLGANLQQFNGDSEGKKFEEYVVRITKDSNGAGIEVQEIDDKLLIVKLREGPIRAWNKTHGAGLAVHRGDRVVAVNGVRGNNDELMEGLKNSTEIEIGLRRPKEWCVVLDKADKELGAGLSVNDKLSMPLVLRVKSGALAEWNRLNPSFDIRSGDRLKLVNGLSGNVDTMLAAIRNSVRLELVVIRPQ